LNGELFREFNVISGRGEEVGFNPDAFTTGSGAVLESSSRVSGTTQPQTRAQVRMRTRTPACRKVDLYIQKVKMS
jgi:hypothetical protein